MKRTRPSALLTILCLLEIAALRNGIQTFVDGSTQQLCQLFVPALSPPRETISKGKYIVSVMNDGTFPCELCDLR